MSVITDCKVGVDDGVYNLTSGAKTTSTIDGLVDYYQPTILSYSDYEPFGMVQDHRHAYDDSYRYGFQGYESDDEIKGENNSYTTEFRQFDPRIGRWLAIDPRTEKYAFSSPYVAFANNPVLYADSDGDTIRVYGSKKEQWKAVGFLQTLTNDELTLKNGMVVVKKVGTANPNKSLPNGTALISEVMKHKNTLIIQQNTDEINKSTSQAGEPRENMSNGIGTNVIVDVDLTHLTEFLTQNPETGKSVLTLEPREITLAHELIHGLAQLNGIKIPYEVKTQYSYQNQQGKQVTTSERQEETETVGLTGNRKHTENKIRKEQGAKKRVKY